LFSPMTPASHFQHFSRRLPDEIFTIAIASDRLAAFIGYDTPLRRQAATPLPGFH